MILDKNAYFNGHYYESLHNDQYFGQNNTKNKQTIIIMVILIL